MCCDTSGRPLSTGPPDAAPRARRRLPGAVLVVVAGLTGLALGVGVPSRGIHISDPLPAAAAGRDGFLAPLGLQRPAKGAAVPSFVLRNLEGHPVSSESLRGKVALLSFFATWCPACTAERPSLRELAARFRGAEFALVLVNYGEPEAAVRAFANDVPFAHATLLDPQTRLGDRLGVKFLPTHFLIDRQGHLVASGVGPKAWDGPEAELLIRNLL